MFNNSKVIDIVQLRELSGFVYYHFLVLNI